VEAFVNAMIWFIMIGCLVGYLIVMHDSVKPFTGGLFPNDSRWQLVTLAAMTVLPLCFLDQKYLAWTSGIAFLVNIYLIGLLSYSWADGVVQGTLPEGVCALGVGKGTVAMLAVLAQCVIIQMCVLPMYEQLEDRSPRRFNRALGIAFGVLTVLFSVFATVGYWTYGPNVQGNVLNNLARGLFVDIARIGTVGVVAAIFPIMVIPMVAPIKNSRTFRSTAIGKRGWHVPLVIFLLVAIAWLGAVYVPDLMLINIIAGVACVGVFTALVPGLVGLQLVPRQSKWWTAAMFFLFAFGFSNAALGVMYPDNYTEDLAAHCILEL